MQKRNAFTTLTLHDGRKATILEATAWDVFKATIASHGNAGAIPGHFLLEVTLIDGKKLEESDLMVLPASDYMAIMEVISVLLTPTTKLNP